MRYYIFTEVITSFGNKLQVDNKVSFNECHTNKLCLSMYRGRTIMLVIYQPPFLAEELRQFMNHQILVRERLHKRPTYGTTTASHGWTIPHNQALHPPN
jgi:hypothetical protein